MALKGVLPVVKFDIASPTTSLPFIIGSPDSVYFCQPESQITWQLHFSVFVSKLHQSCEICVRRLRELALGCDMERLELAQPLGEKCSRRRAVPSSEYCSVNHDSFFIANRENAKAMSHDDDICNMSLSLFVH